MNDFGQSLIAAAYAEGFAVAGALDIASVIHTQFPAHLAHYDQWLADGFGGEMSYLTRGRDRRADPRILMAGAQSVLCVAIPYPRGAAGATDNGATGPRYARYLQGPDYHEEIAERLKRAMQRVAEQCVERGESPPAFKICVDSSAMLERSWAALAGLGWIGKNTLLIHPKLGSYLFLGEVLLDRNVDAGPIPMPDLCGHCTRCLEGCPTQALVAPHRLDSRRCISYLTLEKRGEITAAPEVQRAIGPWVAGCDICQEVCPFNLKTARAEAEVTVPSTSPPSSNATLLHHWEALLDETEQAYRQRIHHSALSRIKPPQFRRNLALSLQALLTEPSTEAGMVLALRLHPRITALARQETDPLVRAIWVTWLRLADALNGHPNPISFERDTQAPMIRTP